MSRRRDQGVRQGRFRCDDVAHVIVSVNSGTRASRQTPLARWKPADWCLHPKPMQTRSTNSRVSKACDDRHTPASVTTECKSGQTMLVTRGVRSRAIPVDITASKPQPYGRSGRDSRFLSSNPPAHCTAPPRHGPNPYPTMGVRCVRCIGAHA